MPPAATPPDNIERTNLYIPLLAYAAGVIFLALAGYQTFRQIENLIQQEKLHDLNAIATMKTGQIVSWRESQARRGAAISRTTLLPSEFEQWLHDGAPTGPRQQRIAYRVSGWQQVYGYQIVSLVDRQGAVRFTTSGGAALDREDIELAQQAMTAGKAILSDIHNDSGDGKVGIDLAAPLIVHDENRSRVVGAALLQINPGDFLYPLIQSWPTRSSTAETLLVREEGGDFLYLNELRHRKDKALTLRLPVDTPNLPPGMFLRGKLDPLNAVDYRGVAVVAAVSRVPGTAWLMVAKIDKAELFAPILKLKQWSAAVGLVFLTICGVLFFVWLRGIQARCRHLKAQRDAAVERELLLKHFEHLTRYANDIILVADENGKIIEANERAVSAYGYTRDELSGMSILALRPMTDDPAVYNAHMARLREAGELIFESDCRRKDGSTFPVEVSARVIEMAGGKYLQGIIRDISERKAAQRRIARLFDLYAAINQTNAVIVRTKDQTALFREICRIAVEHGHFRLAWVGRVDADNRYILPVAFSGPCAGYLDDLIIPLYADGNQGISSTALLQGKAIICNDFEADPRTLPWRNNARKYGLCSSAAWPLMLGGKSMGILNLYAGETNCFDDEMVQLLSSISQDVSFALDNLAMEESLRRSEEKFRTLVENLPQNIFVKDSDLIYVSCNMAYAAALGITPDKISGMTDYDFYPTELAEKYRCDDQGVLNSGEIKYIQEDYIEQGQQKFVQTVKAPFKNRQGEVIGVLGMFWDITERKQAENELLRQKSFLRQVIDADPNVIFVKDAKGRLLLANQAMATIYGMTQDEMLGDKYLASLRRRDSQAEIYLEMDREVIRNRRPVSLVHPTPVDGEERWFLTTKMPMTLPDGTVNVLGILVDITERKRAEEALRESEARFRTMADNAAIIIWMADAQDGHGYPGYSFFNQGWHDFTGLTSEQTQGWNWLERVHPDDRERCLNAYRDAFRLSQAFTHEYRLMRRDGEYRWILDSGVPRCAENGVLIGFTGTLIDITEQKNAEAMRGEIERVGRLNIAVEMASGLAHELSQPLSAANNYLAGCLHRMKEPHWDQEKLRTAVELTYKQTERAGKIINHLKELIRNQGHERLRVDINTLIRDTVNFVEHEIKRHGIVVFMELPPLPLVNINKIEIEQVLLNLLKNAIEAMHGAPEPVLRISTTYLCNSAHILVTVSDTGRGVPCAELATIFNPFQTSKGNGLGLGLAICRSLVENHGGFIWADAQREFGAEFNFTLPYETSHDE